MFLSWTVHIICINHHCADFSIIILKFLGGGGGGNLDLGGGEIPVSPPPSSVWNPGNASKSDLSSFIHFCYNYCIRSGIPIDHAQYKWWNIGVVDIYSTPTDQFDWSVSHAYVINIYIYTCICLWTKKIFESYFSDRLTFSNIRSRTSRQIYR